MRSRAQLTPDGFRLLACATGDRPKSAIVSFVSADGDTWSDPVVELVAPEPGEGSSTSGIRGS